MMGAMEFKFLSHFFYLFTISKPKQLIFTEHQFGFERKTIDAHSDITVLQKNSSA